MVFQIDLITIPFVFANDHLMISDNVMLL